jgi:hypothetical protein
MQWQHSPRVFDVLQEPVTAGVVYCKKITLALAELVGVAAEQELRDASSRSGPAEAPREIFATTRQE